MTDFEKIRDRVLEKIDNIKIENQTQMVDLMAILLFMKKALQDEKTFNDIFELANNYKRRNNNQLIKK